MPPDGFRERTGRSASCALRAIALALHIDVPPGAHAPREVLHLRRVSVLWQENIGCVSHGGTYDTREQDAGGCRTVLATKVKRTPHLPCGEIGAKLIVTRWFLGGVTVRFGASREERRRWQTYWSWMMMRWFVRI